MAMHSQSDYEWLEQLYQSSPSLPARHDFRRFWGTVWSAVVDIFAADARQPRVRKFFDVQGLPIWYIYDPITKQSYTAKTELELLKWLESHT